MPVGRDYTYRSKDKSLLRACVLPYFKVLFRIVPWWLPANMITILGFLAALTMTIVSLSEEHPLHGASVVILILCLHLYVVCDHLDGWQASESGTSSPLGEYLDHYLDSYVGAMVVVNTYLLIGGLSRFTLFAALLLSGLAFAVTNLERVERGEMCFGRLGALEGIALVLVQYTFHVTESGRRVWSHVFLDGLSLNWVLISVAYAGYLLTVTNVLRRLKRIPWQMGLLALVGTTLLINSTLTESGPLLGGAILVLYFGDFTGRVLANYLLGRNKATLPDTPTAIVSIVCTTCIVVGGKGASSLDFVLRIVALWYLCLKVLASFLQTVYEMKGSWVWRNRR